MQRIEDVLYDSQGSAAIFQVRLPWRDVECPACRSQFPDELHF
jgi:hypothetical protein